jgi:hypothetical protein
LVAAKPFGKLDRSELRYEIENAPRGPIESAMLKAFAPLNATDHSTNADGRDPSGQGSVQTVAQGQKTFGQM